MVTVHDPVCLTNGDLQIALFGSFLPIPDISIFPDHPEQGIVPGEVLFADDPIHINQGRLTEVIEVFNTSDRPIQVGSHYHFIETNPALQFDRIKAYGRRLNMYVMVYCVFFL